MLLLVSILMIVFFFYDFGMWRLLQICRRRLMIPEGGGFLSSASPAMVCVVGLVFMCFCCV